MDIIELEKELEKDALEYVTLEKKQTASLFESIKKDNPDLYTDLNSTDKWFAGLRKYGTKWADKVYEIKDKDIARQ